MLFAIWTEDQLGPHANFIFSKKSIFVVDYDGDGDMPYELDGKKLKIYYSEFIKEGQLMSVTTDTLKIKWTEFDFITSYVKWTQ